MCHDAVFRGYDRHLARGERAAIPLIAQDQRATKIAFGHSHLRAYMTGSALLAALVEDVLASEIVLPNGVTITCLSMIKRKFGDSLRTKTDTAMVNKVLAHNLVVLIHALYELGVNPTFEAATAVASEPAR